MTEEYLYKSGLPFGITIAKNVMEQYLRVQKKKASLILVDGGVGEGKTTLSVHISDFLMRLDLLGRSKVEEILKGLNTDRSFDFRTMPEAKIDFEMQLAMGGVEFAGKMKMCFKNKLISIMYDEAGDFNKRGSLTRFNATLNRIFETYRAFKIVVVLSMPCFAVLDDQLFLKNIPRILFNCYRRGERDGQIRVYSLYRMMYIKANMKKMKIPSQAYNSTEPNFRTKFLNLPPEREHELDRISTKGKLEDLDKAANKMEGLMTMKEIANKMVRSMDWVYRTMKKIGVKPSKTQGRKLFFDEGVIDLLMNYMDREKEGPKEGETDGETEAD